MFKRNAINDPQSCLNKAADDEPVFVLRAKDPHAAIFIRQWAEMARATGTHEPEKIDGAHEIAKAMLNWRAARNPMRPRDEQRLLQDGDDIRAPYKRPPVKLDAVYKLPTPKVETDDNPSGM